jgi:hypothetical protein
VVHLILVSCGLVGLAVLGALCDGDQRLFNQAPLRAAVPGHVLLMLLGATPHCDV